MCFGDTSGMIQNIPGISEGGKVGYTPSGFGGSPLGGLSALKMMPGLTSGILGTGGSGGSGTNKALDAASAAAMAIPVAGPFISAGLQVISALKKKKPQTFGATPPDPASALINSFGGQ